MVVKKIKGTLYLIQQAGSLIMMPRSHVRSLGRNTPDSIASHSHHVAVIAYSITRLEGLSHDDGLRVVAMAVFHDLAEARTGDADFIAKNYVSIDEPKAVRDQFRNIPFGKDLEKLVEDYEERKSAVAKCAKDADVLAQIYMEWLLAWQGNRLAERWFEEDFSHRVPYLFTDSAKQIAQAMKESDPHDWWRSEFVENGVNYDHLNGNTIT